MEHSIAARYATRAAARFPRPSSAEPAPASRPRAGSRVQPRPDAPDGAPPRPAVAGRAPPPRPALHHGDPPHPPSTGRPSAGLLAHLAAVADHASLERPRGAVARLRSALATSAGGIVVSANRDRPCPRRRHAPSRAGRGHLDPAEGHAGSRARASRRRPSARSARRPACRSGSWSRCRRSSTSSSRTGRGSTRPCTTS